MTREPYLVLRDFRVWFEKRRGFFAALRKSEPDYIRAVDGIDLDVGRGEMYCLVGESGCGKTTTGKGILKLVEPTGGDVFVGVRSGILADYETARAAGDDTKVESIRQYHSLSWKERRPWSAKDWTLLALIVFGSSALATILPAFVASAFFDLPFASGWSLFGEGIAVGLLLTFFPSIPPTRPALRLTAVLGLLAAVAFNLGAFLSLVFAAYADPAGRFSSAYWGTRTLGMIGGSVAAFVASVVLARVLISMRLKEEGLEGVKIRTLRKKLQIIFQDPYESLNPKHSVYEIVAEPLVVNRLSKNRAETEARVEQALQDAGLRPPRDFMFRFPHELSGGQRQRVSIAGALVLDPEFLVADEPVSMLDVSIRTEILELLLELREKKGLTYLFITHDLSLAWVLADRIGVMYLGKIVEEGPTRELIKNPRHPYTKALVSVVPVPDPDKRRERIILKGERPDPSNIPPGCRFHPRCPVAFERCGWTADEVADELKTLTHGGPSQALFESAQLDGPMAFTLPGAPPDVEATIRGFIETKAEGSRALKAIRAVERANGGVRVSLHESSEPQLRAAAADVKVSCHLFA
ncbi:MAG TPA: oligopeptide/dipeptide ABC transporter ATP-binding protein [Thermoplasmata archaeon]|nr:oligopeptide/dipeptide ABC transporter ATP-binding protein [Thermoplasmata archaeon]